jgi:HAD superfamily hydrolase (TIGR01549 family)
MDPIYHTTCAILFDLDGTLLDSYPAQRQAYQALFAYLGLDISEETFRANYYPNWQDTYRAMGIPPERWEEADAVWMAEVTRHTPALFPQAAEVLERLERSYALGIVTAGSKERVMRDLERAGILKRFQVIITGDDVRERKPHPHGLELALAALVPACPPGQALYIGDTPSDLEMARAAGMPFIGIPSQFPGLGVQSNCQLITSLDHLVDLLE